MKTVDKTLIKKIFKPRDKWVHKGDFGRLLVIGGSRRYSGSPTFNALAAYRTGVDLVTIAAPRRAADIIAAKNNGIRSVGVLWGYGAEDELTNAGADKLCLRPDELMLCLSQIVS